MPKPSPSPQHINPQAGSVASMRINEPVEGFRSLQKFAGICEDIAHIRIHYGHGTVIIRGDPKQTLPEFLISLAERAGEPVERVDWEGV